MERLNLFYDNIVFALQKFGGISKYWFELSKRLLKEENIDIKFFETGKEITNIYRQKLDLNPQDVTLNNRGGIYFERFRRISIQAPANKSIFHSSYFRLPQDTAKIKTVCTVHDFIHDKYLPKVRVFLHNIPKRRAIIESDIIITVSQNTQNDLLDYYPSINPDKVHTIYQGVSSEFCPIKAEDSAKELPFILYIGVRSNYKNFRYVVNLVSQLKQFDLYIVGALLTPYENKLLNNKINNRYKVFTGISSLQLNGLYNRAFCLLYPSSYEGFGIPILEAMQAGCPFIAMNTSSIPEVAGEAGVLLDSLEIEEGLNAVETIKSNYEVIKNKGFEQAKKFSWDNCYQQTLQLYKSLL